jgi:hypothetical protein
MRENNLCGISGTQQAALLRVAPRFSKSTEVSLPGLRVSRSTVEVIVMAMASPQRNERTQRRPAPTGLVVRNDAATYEVEVAKALNQWAVTVTSVADGRMICQDFFSRRWEAVARAEDFIQAAQPLGTPSRLVTAALISAQLGVSSAARVVTHFKCAPTLRCSLP